MNTNLVLVGPSDAELLHLHDLGFGQKRAVGERNEAAISRWRSHNWQRIKKDAGANSPFSSYLMNSAFGCSR